MVATLLPCTHDPKREQTGSSEEDAHLCNALTAGVKGESSDNSHVNDGENEIDGSSEVNGDESDDDDNDGDSGTDDDGEESEDLTSDNEDDQPDKAIGTQALNYPHFNNRTVKSKRSARIFHACQACRVRKAKCSMVTDKDPKCGRCSRMNLVCIFKDPPQVGRRTKKNKSRLNNPKCVKAPKTKPRPAHTNVKAKRQQAKSLPSGPSVLLKQEQNEQRPASTVRHIPPMVRQLEIPLVPLNAHQLSQEDAFANPYISPKVPIQLLQSSAHEKYDDPPADLERSLQTGPGWGRRSPQPEVPMDRALNLNISPAFQSPSSSDYSLSDMEGSSGLMETSFQSYTQSQDTSVWSSLSSTLVSASNDRIGWPGQAQHDPFPLHQQQCAALLETGNTLGTLLHSLTSQCEPTHCPPSPILNGVPVTVPSQKSFTAYSNAIGLNPFETV